jgi:hypothetical protein
MVLFERCSLSFEVGLGHCLPAKGLARLSDFSATSWTFDVHRLPHPPSLQSEAVASTADQTATLLTTTQGSRRFSLGNGAICKGIRIKPIKYVDNPAALLCGAARILRDTSAILSVVVRNQAGEVLKSAIQAGNPPAAETNLNAEWGFESLYGGRVRLFTSAGLRAMLPSESLELIAERGVRVVADYLPPNVSRTAAYERIFELERRLGVRPEFAAIAR